MLEYKRKEIIERTKSLLQSGDSLGLKLFEIDEDQYYTNVVVLDNNEFQRDFYFVSLTWYEGPVCFEVIRTLGGYWEPKTLQGT